jgi:hypothetical protein
VWAALTLIQAWVAEGMPEGSLVVGKYERWAMVMSGIMDVVQLPGLRENWEEWSQGRPSPAVALGKVVAAWRGEFGDRKVKAKALLPVIGWLLDVDPDGGRSAQTELGRRLLALQGHVVDGYEILGKPSSGSMTWWLARRP